MGRQEQVQQPDKQQGQHQGLKSLSWRHGHRIIYIIVPTILLFLVVIIWILGDLSIIYVPGLDKIVGSLVVLITAISSIVAIVYQVDQMARFRSSNESKPSTATMIASPIPHDESQVPLTSPLSPPISPPILGIPIDHTSTSGGPKVYNLRPRPKVLGRDNDIARVLEGLDSLCPVICIEGFSGIGKTTLATEVAYRCLPGHQDTINQPFRAVVWISAIDMPKQKHWLVEVLDTVAQGLDYPSIAQLPLKQKASQVKQLLHNCRTLIIVDNFEIIVDPDLEAWIQSIPDLSKVLITTSHGRLHGPQVWIVRLKGLEDSKTLELIDYHAQRLNLQPTLDAKDGGKDLLQSLVQATGGNPKVIEMALGHIKRGGLSLDELVKALHAANKSVEDVFKYLFVQGWERMSSDAQQVLLVLPFFVDLASKEALGAASGLTSDRLNQALRGLVELALLDRNEKWWMPGQRYGMHPLTRAFATSKLDEVKEFEEQARVRWSKYYLDFATRSLVRGQPKERYWNSLTGGLDSFKLIDPEWSNLRQVLGWLDQQGQNRLLVELMLLLVHYMDMRIQNAERIYYVRRAAEAANKLGWKEDEALFRIDGLGWTFLEEGRFIEAEQEITLGLQIAESISSESSGGIDLVSLANIFLARMFLEQGDLEKAVVYISKVEPTKCKSVIEYRVYFIAGDISHMKGDDREAINLYKKAKLIAVEYYNEVHYRLGFAYLTKGDLERAEAEFNEIVSEGKQYGLTIEAMRAKYGLASVARAKNERDKALHLAQETRRELSRLVNSHPLLNRLDGFLKSLEAE